jgi:hypothetical protein
MSLNETFFENSKPTPREGQLKKSGPIRVNHLYVILYLCKYSDGKVRPFYIYEQDVELLIRLSNAAAEGKSCCS